MTDGQFDVTALKSMGLDTPAAATTNTTGGDETQTATPQPAATTPETTPTATPEIKPEEKDKPNEKPQPAATTPAATEPAATGTDAAAAAEPKPTVTDTATSPAANEPAPTTPAIEQSDAITAAKQAAQAELLKSLGVTTFEELQEKLKPKVEQTPEQVAEVQRKYIADIDAYAVKQNLMSRDEIVTLETLKKTDPQAIVYNEFAKAFKEKNADATDEAIQQNFRLAYNLDSETGLLKEHGENLIKQQADAIVKNLEGKYNSAKAAFDSEAADRSQLPAFRNTIKSSLEQFVPKSMSLIADGDNSVVLDIDAALRNDVEKFLVDNTTFDEFKKMGDTPQMRELLKARIEGFVLVKNIETIKKTVYEAGKAAGLKEGSKVGATAPFPIKTENPAIPVSTEGITTQDDAKLGRLFG